MPSPPIPLLTQAQIAALHAQVATRSAELADELTWLHTLDVNQPAPLPPPATLRLAVFNAERGSRFDGIAAMLRTHPELRTADVLLLNEVDWGMARSGNRHVARELAAQLGLGYVFGTEFLELTKGEAAELEAPGENTWSLHGNAILSRWPLQAPRSLRLPRCCSWAEGTQARIGGRTALLATVETVTGPLHLACVHLENRASPDGRETQMRALIDALPPGAPAVIGGDLNSSTIDSGDNEQIMSLYDLLQHNPQRLRCPEPYEPLFNTVREAGFLIDDVNPPAVPTSVPLGIADPTYWLKLDWIFVRGVHPTGPRVIPAEWEATRVSDHDFVVVDLAMRRS